MPAHLGPGLVVLQLGIDVAHRLDRSPPPHLLEALRRLLGPENDFHRMVPLAETIDQFVVQCHFNLPGVQATLAEQSGLINVRSSATKTESHQ